MRLLRKNDVFKTNPSLQGLDVLIDNYLIRLFRLSVEDSYEFLETLTDEELGRLVIGDFTFSDKRELLNKLNNFKR